MATRGNPYRKATGLKPSAKRRKKASTTARNDTSRGKTRRKRY